MEEVRVYNVPLGRAALGSRRNKRFLYSLLRINNRRKLLVGTDGK